MKSSLSRIWIKKNQDFKKLYSSKKILSNELYTLKYLKNDFGYARYGTSISKKKYKRAVDRNKIKRQIKAILHNIINLKKSEDILILVKDNFLEKEFLLKQKKLIELINKIN